MPTLNVAGWWDQEDFYGPLRIYEALERHDTNGPELTSSSAPGTTAAGAGSPAIASGPIAFDSATAKHFRERGPGPLVRLLPQGQGEARPARGPDLRGRIEPLAALGRLAADGRIPSSAGSTSARTKRSSFDPADRAPTTAADTLRLRPRPPGPVPPPADPADLLPGQVRSGRPGSSRTSGSSTTAPTS